MKTRIFDISLHITDVFKNRVDVSVDAPDFINREQRKEVAEAVVKVLAKHGHVYRGKERSVRDED